MDFGSVSWTPEKLSISFLIILPPSPDPETLDKLTPFSWANFFARGEAFILLLFSIIISSTEILFVSKDLLGKLPFSKAISGIVTDESVEKCYELFNKINLKVSTICNLSSIENLVNNNELLVNTNKITILLQ